MNKYVAITEFEEMLNKKKTAVSEETKPVQTAHQSRPSRWSRYPLVVASCCILVALLAGAAFLRLEGKIGGIHTVAEAAAKDIQSVKAHIASDNSRDQIAAVKAQVDELQAEKMQLQDQLDQMKGIVETVKRETEKHMKGGEDKRVARKRG